MLSQIINYGISDCFPMTWFSGARPEASSQFWKDARGALKVYKVPQNSTFSSEQFPATYIVLITLSFNFSLLFSCFNSKCSKKNLKVNFKSSYSINWWRDFVLYPSVLRQAPPYNTKMMRHRSGREMGERKDDLRAFRGSTAFLFCDRWPQF